MSCQKVLILGTTFPDLRGTIIASSCEDSEHIYDIWVHDKGYCPCDPIGTIPLKLIPKTGKCSYDTVLHALADGWKLLGPPIEKSCTYCEWWLVK